MTLRARLTLLYGALFFIAGAALLGVTYLLVNRSLDTTFGDEDPRRPGTGQVSSELVEQVRAQQEQTQQAALDSLLTQGGLALLGVGVLAAGFGWLVAGRALRPLHRITETAGRIANSTGRGLHERIALTGPSDDVQQLADTFDKMLEHLDRSFDGQRRFVANASHELRTPLAINRTLIELAITQPDAPAPTRQLGDSLLTVNARHERLIDGLLTLADSENEITERIPVDLAEVARHVVEQAAAGDLVVKSTLDPAPTAGDPVLIERLTQNLVENAVRHNEPCGWLAVRTATIDGVATLAVTNTGPVVPEFEIESLFQPFRRLNIRADGERGFGLGLSIVRAIARAHRGEATAAPRATGGLTVTVTLPG